MFSPKQKAMETLAKCINCLQKAMEGYNWFLSPSNTSPALMSQTCCEDDMVVRYSYMWLIQVSERVGSGITFGRRGHRAACTGGTRPGRRRRGRGSGPSRRRAPRHHQESWSASAPPTLAPLSSGPSRLNAKHHQPPEQQNLRSGVEGNRKARDACHREMHVPRTFWVRVARMMISVRMGVTRISTPAKPSSPSSRVSISFSSARNTPSATNCERATARVRIYMSY